MLNKPFLKLNLLGLRATFFLLILLLNGCVIPVNYHGNYDNNSYLNITTKEVIQRLQERGFRLLETKPDKYVNIYIFVKSTNNKGYNVRIYSKSLEDKVNIIEIYNFVPAAYKRGSNTNSEISRHLLPPVIFNNVKRDFDWLECSYYNDFLKNGFECEDQYIVDHAGVVPGTRNNVYMYDYISTIIIKPY